MHSALHDVRVIEYGEFISAPFCGKLLADLGADVIKIEKPHGGDCARLRGPFLDDIPGQDRSGLFLYLNTNKRGVTLDIETATGKAIFKKLVSQADILIEDTQPGKLSKLGLGHRRLKSISPQLVITSVTPYGQTGPYRHFRGSDLTAWQGGGPGYVTPRFIGDNNKEPLRPLQMASFIAGITAAVAVMCALYAQRRDKLGQEVDVSQLEALVVAAGFYSAYWPFEHRSASRADRRGYFPEQHFQCKDGQVFLHAVNPAEHHWRRFVAMMGNPEWANDPLFQTGTSRGELAEALIPLITEWTLRHTKQEIFEMAKEVKVPMAPANSMAEVVNNLHLQKRHFFETIKHPETGDCIYPGAPYKLSQTPWSLRMPAPRPGQHNEEVYGREMGYSKCELVGLYEAEII